MRPDLVQLDRANRESGADEYRLDLPNLYTAIWWYAAFPNHYAGEGGKAAVALGKLINEHYVGQLVNALKTVKADRKTLTLQQEFFDRVKKE